mgnify:FL=1
MSEKPITTEKELIEFLEENTDFTNNTNDFILFVKFFKLYLFARVKSMEVVDNFNPALLFQYFEQNLSVSETYNIIFEEVKKLKK